MEFKTHGFIKKGDGAMHRLLLFFSFSAFRRSIYLNIFIFMNNSATRRLRTRETPTMAANP